MNERLPYEDSLNQKLQEIPLPELEPSWQKMKALLQDEDDDKVVPPFIKGCASVGLVLLLIIGGFLYYHYQYKTKTPVEKGLYKNAEQKNSADRTVINGNKNVSSSASPSAKNLHTQEKNIHPITSSSNKNATPVYTNKNLNQGVQNISSVNTNETTEPVKKNNLSHTLNNSRKKIIRTKSKTQMKVIVSGDENSNTVATNSINKKARIKKTIAAKTQMKVSVASQTDSAVKVQTDTTSIVTIDSTSIPFPVDTAIKQTDSIIKKDTTQTTVNKKQKKKSKYYFAAGLSLQHQLPVNGQKSNNYDAFGRKNSLRDYIPAPYIRFYKENKWFINTGFRYGAPQSVKETNYSSITRLDTTQGEIFVNRSNFIVRKTFYHQIPLNFNVFVTPKFSVGTGIMYSLFNGALSERTTTKSVFRGGVDSVISSVKELINVPASGDSFFTRTQFNFTLQAEFNWRKWGVGAIYTKGLQPFLKYVEAGVAKQQKNESLQIFLRYQLWRQKKK